MLDLSRPQDSIDGFTIYGDHEALDLFYYLPDGIDLSFSAPDTPDLSLEIYYPEEAISGDSAQALEKSVGSILMLGVHCRLTNEQEQALRSRLANNVGNDNIRLVTPPWEDGTVQLMLLDTISGADTTDNAQKDALVSSIIGSRKPSLQDGNLSAIFQAKLDQRGAALTLAAIEGQTSSIAGVLYDLKFAALRPAVDLRMHADLNRVSEAFTMGVGVQIYYVGADVSATFAKLQEQGIIQVELVSEVADQEAEKLVNDAVKDFYDVLMRELFAPMVPPMTAAAGGAKAVGQGSIVKFSFAYTRTQQEKKVEVDYRKRSATIRTHNPQAHLHSLAGLAGGADRVVERIKLSSAWRDFAVEIAAPSAFLDPTLREIRVVLWRGQDGVLTPEAAVDGGLRMPPASTPLADFAFNQFHTDARKLIWVSQPGEAGFYRWQARLTYGPDDHIDSPSEIWTEPHVSSSANLDLYPEILAPKHRVDFQLGEGWSTPPEEVDLTVSAKDDSGTEIATRILRATPVAKSSTWAVRRRAETRIGLEAAMDIHLPGGDEIKLPVRTLLGPQVIANSPFVRPVTITPLVTGVTDDLVEVEFLMQYSDDATGYNTNSTTRLKRPDFSTPDLKVPVLHAGAQVSWQALAVKKSSPDPQSVAKGATSGGIVNIPVTGAVRRIHVEWIGASPADQNLRWLRTSLRVHKENGDIGESKLIEFKGSDVPPPQDVALPVDGSIESSNERLFEDGQHDKTPFTKLVDDTLEIAGQ